MNASAAGRRSKLADPFVSLVVFSIYAGIMGAILLFVPRFVLPLIRAEEVVNAYTFMLGFVLLCSSFYYFSSGLSKDRHFAKLTVYTRLASPVVTMLLFLGGNVPLNFVALSIVDGLGGLWTLSTLRHTETSTRSFAAT